VPSAQNDKRENVIMIDSASISYWCWLSVSTFPDREWKHAAECRISSHEGYVMHAKSITTGHKSGGYTKDAIFHYIWKVAQSLPHIEYW